jgi:hypothetical protein
MRHARAETEESRVVVLVDDFPLGLLKASAVTVLIGLVLGWMVK